jgi:hypothetical protein
VEAFLESLPVKILCSVSAFPHECRRNRRGLDPFDLVDGNKGLRTRLESAGVRGMSAYRAQDCCSRCGARMCQHRHTEGPFSSAVKTRRARRQCASVSDNIRMLAANLSRWSLLSCSTKASNRLFGASSIIRRVFSSGNNSPRPHDR